MSHFQISSKHFALKSTPGWGGSRPTDAAADAGISILSQRATEKKLNASLKKTVCFKIVDIFCKA
jgi:hypothetical protein